MLTIEEYHRYTKMHNEGVSYAELARRAGISYTTFWYNMVCMRDPGGYKRNEKYYLRQLKKAVDLQKDGLTSKEIAEKLGVPLRTLYYMRNAIRNRFKTDVPDEDVSLRGKALFRAKLELVYEMKAKEGLNYTEIAKKMNLHPSTIYGWRSKLKRYEKSD